MDRLLLQHSRKINKPRIKRISIIKLLPIRHSIPKSPTQLPKSDDKSRNCIKDSQVVVHIRWVKLLHLYVHIRSTINFYNEIT